MASRFLTRMCRQHAESLALFAAATRGGRVVDLKSYDRFRSALVQHIAIEERVLMPALTRKLGPAFEATRRKLQQDHEGILALLVPTPNEIWLQDLHEFLLHHFAVEESPGQLHALCTRHLAGDDRRLREAADRLPVIPLEPFEDGVRVPQVLARMKAAVGLPVRAFVSV
ncbi:MAG: Proteophosphoglycan 5 [Myxococcaceae bacterium]|nr:Proteophosphoglycan 5 [Myxococcaceae bacterium]